MATASAQDAVGDAQGPLELAHDRRLGVVFEQVVVSVGLLLDRVREPTVAPVVARVECATTGLDDGLETLDEGRHLTAQLVAQYNQCFVWPHSQSVFSIRRVAVRSPARRSPSA